METDVIRIVVGFMRGLSTLPKPWQGFVALLMLLNMAAPFLFLGTVEARAVLVAIGVATALQMFMFTRMGFVKLLGLGHIVPWVLLLPWLATRISLTGTESLFGAWIAALLVANGLSFVIDVVDVVRYVLGNTEPSYVLEKS